MSARKTSVLRRDAVRARRCILEAAVQLFHQRGLDQVTFGEVARRARLSRPLVYFYFPDMRTLLLEAVLLGTRELGQRFDAASDPRLSGLEETEALGRAYLQFHRDRPELFFLCMATGPRLAGPGEPTPLDRLLRNEQQAAMERVARAVARGIQDRSIRPEVGDPMTVALSLWGLSHGLAQCSAAQGQAIEQYYKVPVPVFLETGFALLNLALAARPKRKPMAKAPR